MPENIVAKYITEFGASYSAQQFKDLLNKFNEGKVPRRLEIGGMIVDTSINANHWSVPKEDLERIAKQLVGKQIRKDHNNSVDSVIGKVTKAWVEDDKVFYKGEIADEDIIKKILLGYLKYDSIQVESSDVFCAKCLHEGRNEKEARITKLYDPCPICGGTEVVVKNAQAKEVSIVTEPAYEFAELVPIGFKASLDKTLARRFIQQPKASNKEKELLEILTLVATAVASLVVKDIIN